MCNRYVVNAGALLFVALAFAPAARAAAPVGKPIAPASECLVANQVSAWGVVHDRRLVVKSLGHRYYDIELMRDCPKLQQENFLSFRNGLFPAHGNARKPLVCGNVGDAVQLTRGIEGTNRPCPIRAIRRIDERTFEAVFGADPAAADQLLDEASAIRRGYAASG